MTVTVTVLGWSAFGGLDEMRSQRLGLICHFFFKFIATVTNCKAIL